MSTSEETLAETLAKVEQVTDAALAHMSLDDLLRELLQRISDMLRSDTAAILLLNEQRNLLVARAAKGIEEEVRRGVTIPVGGGFAGRIAQERRPIAIADLDSAEILNPLLREKGIKSLLGVPLLVSGRVVGVLHVGTLRHREFTDEDVRLLQLAADRAALAVEHAKLYEQQHLAAALQRALLPAELPAVPGLRAAARYVPAAMEARLGGDWYDLFPLPDGRLGVVIGDVVGHGILAASLMAQVRTALRAYALEGHPPTAVARRLNELLPGGSELQTSTLGYFALDLATGEVGGVSAGHLPPLVIPSGGAPYFVELRGGPPLGAVPGARYPEERFELPGGACLLLFTDGLVERRTESIREGLERLRAAAADGDAAPQALCDRVLTRLSEGIEQEDDIAVLAVAPEAIGQRLELFPRADPEVLASLRRQLRRWLDEVGAEPDVAYDLVLACSEAAANAIEHAYSPGHATFEVAATSEGGEVTIAVCDRGRWRPEQAEEPGRGVTLMRELADSVSIEPREGGGTCVTLRRSLSPP